MNALDLLARAKQKQWNAVLPISESTAVTILPISKR